MKLNLIGNRPDVRNTLPLVQTATGGRSLGALMDMFADLLGEEEEDSSDLAPAPHGREFSLKLANVHEIQRGVTVAWLCQAFTMSKSQVNASLAKCPAIKTHAHGGKIYDLRVAARYLVKPKNSIASYIKHLEPKDLPEQLKREFWAARLAEQRWRRQAGELWANEDVIALYSELFKLIKSKAQLWEERVTNVEVLTDLQREALIEQKDELLNQIYKTVLELEAGRVTASSLAEADAYDDQSEE